MPVVVRKVENKKGLKAFIRFPSEIYKNDPTWVPPLEFERKDFFNPKKNPFFREGEAVLFLAEREGKPVGRISAQIHHGHLERYNDATGFFGFFESVNEESVALALIEKAKEWLRSKGMKKIRGPFHFLMYDNEAGILIEGFETPPSIMMGYNPPYYKNLMERAGMQKATDTFMWKYSIGDIPEPAMQLDEVTRSYPGLTLRSFNMKKFDEEVRLMMKIFNEAWAENYGFVPATEPELRYVAKMLRPIIDPNVAFFAFVNEDPAAFSVCLPNIHEAIHDLNGRLLPFGWAKLLWRLKVKRLSSIRLCLMGIRKPYRGSKLGALSVLMNTEMHARAAKRGYKTAELGWTLEDNFRINRGIEFMGGKKNKVYRIFEQNL